MITQHTPDGGSLLHTPAPWRFTHQTNAKRARGKFLVVYPVGDDCPICDVNRHRASAEANTWLIAAAPELLGRLEAALVYIEANFQAPVIPGPEPSDRDWDFVGITESLRAAIAKAKGNT